MYAWHTKVLLVCCLLLGGASSISYNEKVIADQLKIDSTWISDRAQEMVDIIFVMDWSLSVGSQRFNETKEFVRNFLDYFSIATLHAQVGVILFADKLRYPIPLINHNNKCQFMKQLDAVPINTELWTDVYSGINKAWTILKTGSGLSRRGFGASGVAVLITDGYWNKGGDPGPIIKKMKKDNILVIVITVGNFGNDKAKQNEMLRWASFDNRKKRMAFPVENFNKFAEIGYYIHKGSHASKYLPIDPSKCSSTCLKPAKCMCDSLGNRGAPECACPAGKHIKPVANGKSCTSCPIGYYHEEVSNILTECKRCSNRQTTLSRGSVDKRQCVCQLGYWNAQDQTRSPPCSDVTCRSESFAVMDQHHISLKGSCQFRYNQTCRYECHPGYITSGVVQRFCDQSGRMNVPLPTCSAILCPAVYKVPNSVGWKCYSDKGVHQSGQYPYRTMCQNSCSTGFILRPGTASNIMCGLDKTRLNGQWSGKTLVCEHRSCTRLPEILNGQYNSAACSTEKHTRVFGQVCRVDCNHGYASSHDVQWECLANGTWSNYETNVICQDVKPPEFLSCPQHITLDNAERESYATIKLQPLKTMDNDRTGTIKQSMMLKLAGQKTGTQYPCEATKCGEEFFTFPIGTSDVRFIAEDRSGNKADCDFQVTVQDIESPTVVQCDGPVKDSSGFIYTDQQEANVQWKLPEFSDNSGEAVEMFSTGTPGTYRVGRTWTIAYTAKDKAGNTAKCEFSFKLSGIRCPTLHVPASGALVCDSLAFGVYCVPHCEKGLTRLLPDYVRRQPADYFCTTRGTWLPHADVGDCAIPTPVTADTIAQYEFTWYEGNCNDEQTQKTIIQNTIDALDAGGPSFVGQGFKADQDGKLTVDDFVVFCGAKNESIVQIQPGGSG